MGYMVLITIQLPWSTPKQREVFEDCLKEIEWRNILSISNSWCIFLDDTKTHSEISSMVVDHLQKAKDRSGLIKVEYTFQMDTSKVKIAQL